MASGNPTLPSINDATANSLQDTLNAATGIKHLRHGHDPADTPPLKTALTEFENRLFTAIAAGLPGLVVKVATLTIGVFSVRYVYGGTDKTFAGETSQVLSANNTHYVYLDAAATLKTSTSAFPANAFRLAVVTTGASDITAISDRRWQNTDTAGSSNWYNVAAAADVDMGSRGLLNLLGLGLDPFDDVTISSGLIAPTRSLVTVQPETGSSDQLDNVSSPMSGSDVIRPTLLFLQPDGGGTKPITVKHGLGISLADSSDLVLEEATDLLVIVWNGFSWFEVTRVPSQLKILPDDVNVNSKALTSLGRLNLGVQDVEISSGQIDPAPQRLTRLRVETEGGAASDTLDDITAGTDGDLIILEPLDASHVVTVANSSTVRLEHDKSFVMSTLEHRMVLVYRSALTAWVEVMRNRRTGDDIAETTFSVPQTVTLVSPGALSSGVQKFVWVAPYDCKLVDFTGFVDTAPSGGPCIVNVLVNSSSVFASDANAVNIADGTNQDTSNATSPVFSISAGDLVEIDVKTGSGSPNSAADLTLILNCMVQLQPEP